MTHLAVAVLINRSSFPRHLNFYPLALLGSIVDVRSCVVVYYVLTEAPVGKGVGLGAI